MKKKIMQMVFSRFKWLLFPVLMIVLQSAKPLPHPFHVSVIEINHNKEAKSLEISCKIFTDDFESILAKNYKTKIDLSQPAHPAAMDTLVKKYMMEHISIAVNTNNVKLHYLGFEVDKEAVYSYIEIENIPIVTRMDINSNMMYDLFDDQVNIFHVTVNGNRKSNRLNYPDKKLVLSY